MPNIRIPHLVKHCTIAIYRESAGIESKTKKDRFIQCLKIARSRLAAYGFIVLSGESVTDPIGLTPKGRAREMKHRTEGRAKSLLFDTLYDGFDLDGLKAQFDKVLQEKAARAVEKTLNEKDERDNAKAAAAAAKGQVTAPKPKRPRNYPKKDLL